MGFVIKLGERIDTSNAAEVEKRILAETEKTDEVPSFDASELTYISSAGLRILLKVKKKYPSQKLWINWVSPEIYDILENTGFTVMFDVKKRMREVSVDGCEVIGKGFYGTVYRLDDETIVKVYEPDVSLFNIEIEQQRAKSAFVNGLPTAIPYDTVRVGECYGAVYELFRSKTLNEILIEEPDRADELIEKYVDFIKQIHGTRAYGVSLPTATGAFWRYLDYIRSELPSYTYEILKKMLSLMPYDDRFVHGDLQMKNVMMCDGELMLIDMDTLTKGQPVFDLQALYVTYELFLEDDPDNSMDFLGISADMSHHIWNRVIRLYLGTEDERTIAAAEDKIRLLALIRFMYIILSSSLSDTELGQLRISHAKKSIEELLKKVNSFAL